MPVCIVKRSLTIQSHEWKDIFTTRKIYPLTLLRVACLLVCTDAATRTVPADQNTAGPRSISHVTQVK